MSSRARRHGAIVAAVLAGWAAVAADALVRDSWHDVRGQVHAFAALGLYAAVGTLAGLTAWIIARAARSLERRARPHLKSTRWMLPVAAAVAGAAFFHDTIEWTFGGMGVRDTALARWGPPLMSLATGAGFAGLALAVRWGLGAIGRGERLRPVLAGGALLAAAAVLSAIDLTVFVALYSRLHEMLELIAALLAASGLFLLVLLARARSQRLRLPLAIVGSACVAWLALFVASSTVRSGIDGALAHVWHEPNYVGRMLMRVQLAESFLRDPAGWRGARASRIARLKQRFDISTFGLSPVWETPLKEPPALRQALRERRKHATDFNVVVFYVDTLRHDVTTNARLMPHTVELAKRSIDFRRAYSFASDTVSALPVLTSGSYFEDAPQGNMVEVARSKGLSTALVIAKSARRFMQKLVPTFRFEHTIDVIDYEHKREVWGYGADRPSAIDVVDEALNWIDGRTSERFFAWLFHFDVHNWRELDAEYIEQTARDVGIEEADNRLRRYQAAAAGVDRALGRFVRGLGERDLADKTILLFVSDHGEALGRQGHWQHAVFLWESLVRTPLLLHVPGMSPAIVDTPVGHADVAPTLVRFLDPLADVSRYHGHDLLRHGVPGANGDGLPLLLMSMRKEDILRVGIIERRPPYHKLVLPLESAEPELHDLEAPEPDDVDVARERRALMLEMLSKLVRSPVFPRDEETAAVEGAAGERTARR